MSVIKRMEKYMARTINTKDRILKAASKIFLNHGYKEATIRMISEKAKVNVASINYYYKNKEDLYLAVINYWAEDAFKDFPMDQMADPSTPPQEKIKIFIYHTLLCLLGKNGKGTGFGRLIAMEAAVSLSSVVNQVIADTIGRPTELLKETVRELTHIEDEEKLKVYTACIVGQTVYFYMSRNINTSLFGIEPLNEEEKIRTISEYIFNFCMNALS